MSSDRNFGARDFLLTRMRIRNARKPSALEILVLSFQDLEVPISTVSVPREVRRGVE
jgi:hypothetical protein